MNKIPQTTDKENIRVFLTWIEAIDIRNSQPKKPAITMNGPYADIKELIGKIPTGNVQFNGPDCH